MNKLPKKALSIVTTCAMTLSLANPVLMVAAEEVTNKTAVVESTAKSTEESKCNLASLSVNNQTLSPEFSADVLDYTLPDLPYSTNSITVKATAETEGSTVQITYTNYNGQEKTASSSGSVSGLKYGKNVIKIAVTSEDGSETKDYSITVNRKSALSSITATVDSKELTLTPSFASKTNDYEATIAKGSKSVLIKATASVTSKYNTIKVNGEVLGEDGVSVDLNGSSTKVEVTITGDEGKGENTYNLTIKEVDSASLKVNTNVDGAVVRLIDPNGKEVSGNGEYTGLLSDSTYTLLVLKYGYITHKEDIQLTAGEQTKDVALEQAPASTLQEVISEWKNFRGNDENMGITNAKTPRNSSEATIKWNVKLGTGWSAAPSVQIEVDDSIVVMSGKNIYKLSKEDGSTIAKGDMVAAPSYGYTPPVYTNGMIIAPLGGGIVQAFNAKTLESLWVSESFGGQALSPIASSDGNVYLGFWNSEVKDADFVCISITDEDTTKTNETKYASWKFTVKGGFYWAGAYVTGDSLIIGTDDGESGYQGTGHVYSLNKNTGAVIDSIEVTGDQRSTISYDKTTDRIFFTTKAGYLYSIKVKADGTFDKSTLKSKQMEGQCTSTPAVYNGRVYIGTGTLTGGGKVVVADASSLEIIYEAPLKGYPQASVLVSNAYSQKENGKVYVYCTYNKSPGGITVLEDSPGQTEAIYSELIELPSELQQFCIASPICDSDGTIYYKNDSCNVIAIANTNKSVDVTFDADNGTESVVKSVSEDEALEYTPEAPTKEGYTFVGWYRDTDDITTEYQSGEKYTEDVIYKAKWAHVDMLGAQVKAVVNDKSGIRFGTKIYNDGDEIVEKGTLILPAKLLEEGETLTLTTPKVAQSIGKVNYEVNEEKNYVTYLGTIVNIPRAQFDTEITASSYVKYEDKNGNSYTVYSPYKNGSTTVNKLSSEN